MLDALINDIMIVYAPLYTPETCVLFYTKGKGGGSPIEFERGWGGGGAVRYDMIWNDSVLQVKKNMFICKAHIICVTVNMGYKLRFGACLLVTKVEYKCVFLLCQI